MSLSKYQGQLAKLLNTGNKEAKEDLIVSLSPLTEHIFKIYNANEKMKEEQLEIILNSALEKSVEKFCKQESEEYQFGIYFSWILQSLVKMR